MHSISDTCPTRQARRQLRILRGRLPCKRFNLPAGPGQRRSSACRWDHGWQVAGVVLWPQHLHLERQTFGSGTTIVTKPYSSIIADLTLQTLMLHGDGFLYVPETSPVISMLGLPEPLALEVVENSFQFTARERVDFFP